MAHEHELPTLEDVKECAADLLAMLFGKEDADLKKIIPHIWVIVGYGLRMYTEWTTPVIGSGPELIAKSGLSEDEAASLVDLVSAAQLEDVPKGGPLSAWIIKAAIAKAVAELWDIVQAILQGMDAKQAVENCDCDCCHVFLENFTDCCNAVSKLNAVE